MEARGPAEEQEDAVRFEDLTVDDDLPIIERVVRYTTSQIALQRLVHVKMLAECAELAGKLATQKVLIPMLENLLNDSEAVIRQHIAGQLLQLSIVAMLEDLGKHTVEEYMKNPALPKHYCPTGVALVQSHVVSFLDTFLHDPEVDVRRAAADALAGLCLQHATALVEAVLPLPARLVADHPAPLATANPNEKRKRTEAEQRAEELRVTACNVYAELGGTAGEQQQQQKKQQQKGGNEASSSDWVPTHILPAVQQLAADDSFRVRRAAAQALPRILAACSPQAAKEEILPTFLQLSTDSVHRVRKSTGECLVDMSRALMMVADRHDCRAELRALRVEQLLPIADRLIQDSHKQVRQGMMQFLGPFMASFYPYQYSALHNMLPSQVESDGSHHRGIVAQFFPHASSMVARLNSSQNAVSGTPTPVHSSLEPFLTKKVSETAKLQALLPQFIHAGRLATLSLAAVTKDRQHSPPDPADLEALAAVLLDYFAALSVVSTGDENTDAEMRVYCSYSFPALALLLGPENWEGSMRTCFFTLLNPSYGQEDDEDDDEDGENGANKDPDNDVEPPLPVKRCLASSLHTVAHILGPEIAQRDVIPAVQEYFLPDADDSVRLNMIRNFGALLSVLPPDQRETPFLAWSEVVQGESFLGGRKRSVTNPLVLNWRQRNYLARSLPELIGLLSPQLVHDHIWPIVKVLLMDHVNDVRDDALWSVAMLLRAYCPETLKIAGAKKFCTDKCNEVIDWIVNNILMSSSKSRTVNFGDRQVYCKICGSVGLALRLSEDTGEEREDPVSVLSDQIKNLFLKDKEEIQGPYLQLTEAEQKHLKRLLRDELLPGVLEMKEDRTSNVRITLMKVLQIMPFDIRTSPSVKKVLKALEEENETWTSFGGDDAFATTQADEKRAAGGSSGPVDVDDVAVTPDASDVEEPPQRRQSGLDVRTVVFEDGPIGMQLEPTRGDKACRVYGFNDFGPGNMSPAQTSGKIMIGDVIVSVNGVVVDSYDHTIELLRGGGKREVVFRLGTEAERASDDEDQKKSKKKRRSKSKKDDESSVSGDKKKKKTKKKSDGHDSDEDSKRSTKSSKSRKSKKASRSSSSGRKMDKIQESEEGEKKKKNKEPKIVQQKY